MMKSLQNHFGDTDSKCWNLELKSKCRKNSAGQLTTVEGNRQIFGVRNFLQTDGVEGRKLVKIGEWLGWGKNWLMMMDSVEEV